MKHVWILNHYAQEPGGPGGTRHYSLASNLRNFGWTASIIASSTEYKTGRQRLAPNETNRLDHIDGVPFLWLKTSPYVGNGAGRIRNMGQYTFEALKQKNLSNLQPPDAVIGSCVHPLAGWAGLQLAKRYNVPFLFEIRDLWPQTLIDMGSLSEHSPITWSLRRLERSLCLNAAKLIVLLPRAEDYLIPLGTPPDRIVWIPNGVDFDTYPAQPYPTRDNSPFTLMYFGAHGLANGLDNLLQAMEVLNTMAIKHQVHLRLIGDGPLKPMLQELAAQKNLNATVTFENPVPKHEIPGLAAQADAFVFNLIDAPVFRYGISSNKLFDYMAAARPVILACDAANNPVADAGAGPSVPPHEPQQLANAIAELVARPRDELAQMGADGRAYVIRHHDIKMLAQRLAETLDTCTTSR